MSKTNVGANIVFALRTKTEIYYGDTIIRQTYNTTRINDLKKAPAFYINAQNEKNPNCSTDSKTEQILRHHVWGTMGYDGVRWGSG